MARQSLLRPSQTTRRTAHHFVGGANVIKGWPPALAAIFLVAVSSATMNAGPIIWGLAGGVTVLALRWILSRLEEGTLLEKLRSFSQSSEETSSDEQEAVIATIMLDNSRPLFSGVWTQFFAARASVTSRACFSSARSEVAPSQFFTSFAKYSFAWSCLPAWSAACAAP